MRQTNRAWTVVAGLALASVLAACSTPAAEGGGGGQSGEPVAGGDITIVRPVGIDGWDPESAFEIESFQTLPMVMEGLLRPDPEGKGVVAGLASEWEFDESRTRLTFTLRPEAKFSDGSPVTADDVVFSVRMWQKGMSYGPLYEPIKSARAVDEHTVRITLKKPSSVTLAWLAAGTSVVVPADFGGKERKEFFDDPIGAGPFKIEEYKAGRTTKLVRNPHYYDSERPYLDSITYNVISDPNQRLLQYQRGEIDVIETVPASVTEQIPEAERSVVAPATTVQSAWVNLERSPTDDVHFRRAVSAAIDRAAYVEAVFDGYADVAEAGLPQGVEGSATCGCDAYRQDLDKARDELAASGYDGEEIVMLAPNESPVLRRGSQVVAQMLEEIGINVDLQLVERQVMYDLFEKGEFHLELAEISSVSPTVGDIFSLMPYMVPGLDDDAVAVIDEAYAKLEAAEDESGRQAATRRLERWWAKELPYVPIATPHHITALKPRVEGFKSTAYLMYPADQLWLGGT